MLGPSRPGNGNTTSRPPSAARTSAASGPRNAMVHAIVAWRGCTPSGLLGVGGGPVGGADDDDDAAAAAGGSRVESASAAAAPAAAGVGAASSSGIRSIQTGTVAA